MAHNEHFLARLERLDPSQGRVAFSPDRNVPFVNELLADAQRRSRA